MTQQDIEKLLGRSLTPAESANFAQYLQIAQQSLSNFLCFDLLDTTPTRIFDAREGYSTVFIPPFQTVTEVKVHGVVRTDYSKRQWDRRTGTWFNSLVFPRLLDDVEVEVTGTWGFGAAIPVDLQLVIARAFALITKQNKFDPTVKKKDVEDFSVTLDNTVDLDDAFYQQNEATLSKYSLCGVGNISHGRVC